jgi:glucose-6-phosphate 1-dehydrogenase
MNTATNNSDCRSTSADALVIFGVSGDLAHKMIAVVSALWKMSGNHSGRGLGGAEAATAEAVR